MNDEYDNREMDKAILKRIYRDMAVEFFPTIADSAEIYMNNAEDILKSLDITPGAEYIKSLFNLRAALMRVAQISELNQ
jgi:hypothetical protein